MSLTYEIDNARRVALVTGTDTFTFADVEEVRGRFATDADFQTTRGMLFDLRAVTKFALSGEEVRSLARTHNSLPFLVPSMRTAIVVSSAEGYGLARMYEMVSQTAGEAVHVFSKVEDALEWLEQDAN